MTRITKEQYDEAVQKQKESEQVILGYHRQKAEDFQERLRTNPIFTVDELFFSREARCPCGAGLAYPKECGTGHYWDCSAILMGTHDENVTHTDKKPFSFWDVKGERDGRTTRPSSETKAE